MVDGRWLDCVSHHDQLFRDEYALYRPLQVVLSVTANENVASLLWSFFIRGNKKYLNYSKIRVSNMFTLLFEES